MKIFFKEIFPLHKINWAPVKLRLWQPQGKKHTLYVPDYKLDEFKESSLLVDPINRIKNIWGYTWYDTLLNIPVKTSNINNNDSHTPAYIARADGGVRSHSKCCDELRKDITDYDNLNDVVYKAITYNDYKQSMISNGISSFTPQTYELTLSPSDVVSCNIKNINECLLLVA